MGRKARRIRGKDTWSPVLRAVTTNEDDDEIELNTQKEMIPAIAESNKVRQQQCIGTPFMSPPLVGEFGYLADE